MDNVDLVTALLLLRQQGETVPTSVLSTAAIADCSALQARGLSVEEAIQFFLAGKDPVPRSKSLPPKLRFRLKEKS